MLLLSQFEVIQFPPGSAFFILGIALIAGVITQLITKLITDTEQLKRYTKQTRLHKEAKKKAEEEGNVKKLIQLKRKDKYIQKISTKMAKERLKPLLFTIVPLFILFFILSGFFQTSGGPILVAYTPFSLEGIPLIGNLIGKADAIGYGLYFAFWYIIVNVAFSTVISRAFGTSGE
ncbi:MAG: EMC3/TMCO1 family protein [Candidatus Odinarchaeia archaeon]